MLVQTLKFDKGIVNIHDDYIPKDQKAKKKKLKSMYDTFNLLHRNCKQKGINIDDWFYTPEELEKLKKSNEYEFIT